MRKRTGSLSAPRPGLPVRVLTPLDRRPIGTNGYVSTWGAVLGVRPPGDR
ncbi:hypothetical protein [Streptomyces tremellae]|uniref:Uncharacterized protein n=1 Tax=Streptomyces tremellae TaxID=1124239 RepID=A0ABP7G5X8_9ACTN